MTNNNTAKAKKKFTRVIFNGQTGLDKKTYLDRFRKFCEAQKENMRIFSIGPLMYQKNGTIPSGKILDIEPHRRSELRSRVFEEILNQLPNLGGEVPVIVNSHATFRWSDTLSLAINYEFLQQFNSDLFITLVDNVDSVWLRLKKEYPDQQFTLKDVLVWREEETNLTELMAKLSNVKHYIIAKNEPHSVLFDIIFNPSKKKIYTSFPMSLVAGMPDVEKEIETFRERMAKFFVVFNPATIEERRIIDAAREAKGRFFELDVLGEKVSFNAAEVISLRPIIDGQIEIRDYKLIEQADLLIAYVPEVYGRLEISGGVSMEIKYAKDIGHDVYIISPAPDKLTPFYLNNSKKIFESFEKAETYFEKKSFC